MVYLIESDDNLQLIIILRSAIIFLTLLRALSEGIMHSVAESNTKYIAHVC